MPDTISSTPYVRSRLFRTTNANLANDYAGCEG